MRTTFPPRERLQAMSGRSSQSLKELGEQLRTPIEVRTLALGRRVLDVGSLFALCALVGVIAGVGAIGFHCLLQFINHFVLDGLAGYRPPAPLGEAALFAPTQTPFSRWILFGLPAVGGLVGGAFVFWLAPEAEGHGTDAAIDAYHHKGGAIRARVPFVKTVASAITIGTGGSAGREGPIAQIGAGLGSSIAKWLGLTAAQRRILMAAGLGAGIGAIFRAPLAGALFAGEVLYAGMDIEFEVIAPAILASIVGYSTFGLVFGWEPLFHTPHFRFTNPLELGPYVALAVIVAVAGRLYTVVFYGARDWFKALAMPRWLKPALGGLGVGLIGLLVPEALSTSFGVVQQAFDGETTARLLFAVALAKVLATALTVGSGGSGGVFGPAVVIGGSLGGAVGLVFHDWMPSLVKQPGAFAMVGMAGFFASAAHVPISTVIMVSELTGDYDLLVPSMLVCMLGSLLVRRRSIYEKQLPSRADSPAHRREAVLSMLTRLVVRDVLRLRPGVVPVPLREDASLAQVLAAFSATGAACLPVVDQAGRITGQVNREAVQHTLGGKSLPGPQGQARDLSVPPATVVETETLQAALRLMTARSVGQLLVVDPASGQAIAILTGGDVNAIYDEFLKEPAEAGTGYAAVTRAA